MKTYSDIVDEVRELALDDKEALQDLLEKWIIEARRDEIHNNYQQSKQQKFSFTSDLTELKQRLSV